MKSSEHDMCDRDITTGEWRAVEVTQKGLQRA